MNWKSFNLVNFIVNLIGLSEEKVNTAFSEFMNQYQLSAVQIQFLDTLKLFLTKNGKNRSAKTLRFSIQKLS